MNDAVWLKRRRLLAAMAAGGGALGCGVSSVALASLPSPDLFIFHTKSGRLDVFKNGERIQRVRPANHGKNGVGSFRIQGSRVTPEGRYRICAKNPNSRFHRFLMFDYPNPDDADAGHHKGVISSDERTAIHRAHDEWRVPPQETALGGAIGIHGTGDRPTGSLEWNWTDGCIAIDNTAMEDLFERTTIGTLFIVRNDHGE